ncbi:dehydrogenase/reductase SDR family protein 7-like [Copidosoma floridanum]|uniref:dehydrogenase/reductase SDR family protein 7-like n=1 Tax=Copidosoma floridanum TaxID=29053 RepID=UPI0006C97649|nr:dehydrogenase/reductase SDR family protein 7-like [Copidosoma floridanum]
MKHNDSFVSWQAVWWMFTIIGLPVALPWIFFNFMNTISMKKKKAALNGKVVLITGASSGLGEALARVFYSYGCKLILVARRKPELQRVKDTLLSTHHTVPTHVPIIISIDLAEIHSLPSEVAKVLEIYEKVDVLINNAGISYRGEILDTKTDIDVKVMLINYFGQVALTKAVLPSMVKQNCGHVVCISSIQGKIAIPFRSAYAASKHALQAWCDTARAELDTKKIKVTVVNPGYIKTSLSLNAVTGSGEKYGIMDETTEKGYPPSEVAEKILNAVLRGDEELTICNFSQRVAILIRVMWPSAYFWIMKYRAKKLRKNK